MQERRNDRHEPQLWPDEELEEPRISGCLSDPAIGEITGSEVPEPKIPHLELVPTLFPLEDRPAHPLIDSDTMERVVWSRIDGHGELRRCEICPESKRGHGSYGRGWLAPELGGAL